MPGVGSDVRMAQLEPTWSAQSPGYVEDLAFSPRGDLLAAASVEGPVTVFDGATGEQLSQLPGHGFGTTSISFSLDGRLLASAGQDGKVRLWDPVTGGELCALDGGSAWVEKVNFSPDGRYLASAAGKRIRMWKPHGGEAGPEPLWESADHESTVTDVSWKPGSSKELVSAAYGGLTFYKPATPEPLRRFEWKGSTLAMEWSPNGKYIATGDQDSTVHFWIVGTGEDLQMFGYPTKVRELSWDPTSRYLATGGGPGVTVWDCSGKGPAGTTPITLEGHEDYVSDLAFQHRGPLLASAGQDGIIALWRPGTRSPVALTACDTGAARLAWSPNDSGLAVGCDDGQVSVFAAP